MENKNYDYATYDENLFRYDYDTEMVDILYEGNAAFSIGMKKETWMNEQNRVEFLTDWINMLFLQIMSINHM